MTHQQHEMTKTQSWLNFYANADVSYDVAKQQKQFYEWHTYEQLILSVKASMARVYWAESTPSLLLSFLLVVGGLAPPCAPDVLIGRCSDVGTTTVSRPDERLCSKVLYSAPHLFRNSAM